MRKSSNFSHVPYLILLKLINEAVRGRRQEFSNGGGDSSDEEGIKGTINAKGLRKNRFPPSEGGL